MTFPLGEPIAGLECAARRFQEIWGRASTASCAVCVARKGGIVVPSQDCLLAALRMMAYIRAGTPNASAI